MLAERRSRRTGVTAAVLGALLAVSGVSGCSKDAAPEVTAAERLAQAKRKLDAASSARFTLTTDQVPESGPALVGGEGVMARPRKFQGDLDVRLGAGTATVSVISVDGKVFAKLPFASAYARTDLKQFGLGDPGELMDPDSGLSTLLVRAENAKFGGKSRINGEVVQEISATAPGEVVADLLVSADPTKPVAANFALTEDTGELRRVTLTGPFFKAGVNSIITVVLDGYGEKVTITAPDVASP